MGTRFMVLVFLTIKLAIGLLSHYMPKSHCEGSIEQHKADVFTTYVTIHPICLQYDIELED
jgi:hypothetical protein